MQPNAWGVFDMHGNIEEWCHDITDGNVYAGDATDPWGLESGSNHVRRGDSYASMPKGLRSASRSHGSAGTTDNHRGFRIARSELGTVVSNCADGIDNDDDGWTDETDPDCDAGETELGFGSSECNDGIDNDGDTYADVDDPDCVTAEHDE